jgi:hypothetical protein
MSAPLRLGVNVATSALALGVIALGGAWLGDRGHRWVEPRWPDASFVRLSVPAGAARTPLWVVPVNPYCPHCMTTLARLAAEWPAKHPGEPLVALIVDSVARPAWSGAMPLEAVWWDRRGVWRSRWGHRLYGELIRFDAGGRYVGTITGEAFED